MTRQATKKNEVTFEVEKQASKIELLLHLSTLSLTVRYLIVHVANLHQSNSLEKSENTAVVRALKKAMCDVHGFST